MAHTWSVPFFKMWGALGAGAEFADALADARSSIERTAQTDLSIAQAATMSRLAARVPAVQGYRRVLAGDGCEFCVEASEETYGSDDLMPLHAGCQCSVAPIVDDEDPGETLNHEETEGAAWVPEDEEKDRQIADLRRELGGFRNGPPTPKPRRRPRGRPRQGHRRRRGGRRSQGDQSHHRRAGREAAEWAMKLRAGRACVTPKTSRFT